MTAIWKVSLSVFSLLIVLGCSGPGLSIDASSDSPANTGVLKLTLNDSTRTLSPGISMKIGHYDGVLTKNGQQITQIMDITESMVLEAGVWALQVDAYNDAPIPVKIGTGSKSFTIEIGQTTAISLSVLPLTGNGVLDLGVDWSGLTLINPKVTATLTPQGSSTPQALVFTLGSTVATYKNTAVPAGYYTLVLGLYDGTTKVKDVIEVVRILAGATTQGTFSFGTNPVDGSVVVTISIDLKIPAEVVISGLSASYLTGDLISITASTTESGVSWTWYLNGVLQTGTSATFSFNAGSVGTYRVDAFAAKGTMLTSGYKIFTVVNAIETPVVSAAPGTQSFTTPSVVVTLSASSPASGQYRVDGGSWTDFTSGKILTLGAALSSGQSVSLDVKNGTAANTYVYTKNVVVETGTTIGFKKSGTVAPTIWLWETSGTSRAIMASEGKTWPGPGMTAAGDVADYWIYIIPENYKPLGSLAFKFDSGAQIDLSVADIAAKKTWYNGSAWGLKPVPVAQKPSISITPEGGYFDPSVAVTITITDDGVAGATIAANYAVNGGAPVTVGAGSGPVRSVSLNLNATTSLVVTATNSAGTQTSTVTFTKGIPATPTFSWDNASVYFVITDRFFNGNTGNDSSYGRVKVDATGKDIGTFHGGDVAGLKAKVDSGYFTDLGVNAIWMTAPYEQMHGFVGGGTSADFAHYAYHGYYALDYSNMDASMGTKEEFKSFVDAAHAKGIRVILDIVMNHSGYLSIKDMDEFAMGGKKAGFNSSWTPSGGQTWGSYHDLFIDYAGQSAEWGKWWGGSWVRAGLPGYGGDAVSADSDPVKGNLAGLPDFRTESESLVALPTFLQNKTTYGGAFSTITLNKGKTQKVREWLAEWLTSWVREYGIDGFRVDTAKHVERSTWAYLKDQSVAALKAWRLANPTAPGANWTEDFWTTAEVFDQGMAGYNGDFHGNGKFDSLINFGFTGVPGSGYDSINSTYGSYAAAINSNKSDKWNYLSFIDNHDKGNVYYNGDATRQIKAGTALLLAPGGIQIYYGDEYGRANGANGSDKDQGSRSDYVWSDATGRGAGTLAHWQKLGQFRNRHLAVGGGDHASIGTTSGIAFTRIWNIDKVAAVMGASGSTSVTVSSIFADGTVVKNAYDNTTATVTGGKVTFSAGSNGVILIEKN